MDTPWHHLSKLGYFINFFIEDADELVYASMDLLTRDQLSRDQLPRDQLL